MVRLPISALLSQAWVAFTIEFDNEFEHRVPHQTTLLGGTGLWLGSMVLWFSCMRFVEEKGITERELEMRARAKTNVNGMKRWGYITVVDKVIRATPKGLLAKEVWVSLFEVIEARWRERFEVIPELCEALKARVNPTLPDFMPILGYGLFNRIAGKAPLGDQPVLLPALLARLLLAFALEFERDSELSLAICANVLRVIDEAGVRVRDIPQLSGVSKESIAMAMGMLQKRHLVYTETRNRVRVVRLTARGLHAQEAYHQRIGEIEAGWQANTLRDLLEKLTPLEKSLEPYPDNWRAKLPRPVTLPHFPMVLHRGGFPDGS